MKLRVTLDLDDDQADTINALAFLERRTAPGLARDALTEWLTEAAEDPHVDRCKRIVRIHRSGLKLVTEAPTGSPADATADTTRRR